MLKELPVEYVEPEQLPALLGDPSKFMNQSRPKSLWLTYCIIIYLADTDLTKVETISTIPGLLKSH